MRIAKQVRVAYRLTRRRMAKRRVEIAHRRLVGAVMGMGRAIESAYRVPFPVVSARGVPERVAYGRTVVSLSVDIRSAGDDDG